MSEIQAERRAVDRPSGGKRRVPLFLGFSMFIVALLLYFALTSSVFLILGIQSLPQIAARYPSVLEFTQEISASAAAGELETPDSGEPRDARGQGESGRAPKARQSYASSCERT
ncbi:MAG: hypothetical protein ACLFP4_08330 [Spirochaetales bacterium]